ncbi:MULTISPECIES: type II toxin-antitoxin system HipA family toxin [unclassified Salinivibrio]|uniref:type II toxin-antitoxin system HipA family toxin n=1 Tax=unclassified Salinivibrio TaxID=2636825 RepID=UPI00128CFF01|nr:MULTISPECIES: type II toxin-antitoxin system HipA family toxin [unclassified Salinivibrio]MPS31531.1 type II toxin-antitoxin system HipA family toxin [Salinivibrio sp. VYel7]MPX90354.1 type II toxin-antitoxin system HipA family toxin [Salinivibrio sp. VYel1]MPX92926.1 type II toxin-antitoxin system HipA family toxin [Salinivibrio sp. VYel9]MPX95390.1 type II toxin-antitoxin system HipA family toxin [Salinivibrio sp. VYel6]MPX99144.1 type II toxin-antitoxin system HipA family toxin [Salinivi
MTKTSEKVEGLNIQLHGVDVAIVTHYAGGKNILTFNPAFIATSQHERLTFSLRQRRDPQYLRTPQIRTDKLPPVLSNLLPEGALRDVVSKALQCHTNNEFAILAYMGKNLPGAIVATPIKAGELPRWALAQRLSTAPQQIDVKHADSKFSLAGVQMKFSSSHRDGRYHIDHDANEDSWIIKTPSTVHKGVPLNEFTCMTLAAQAGAVVPERRLINVVELEGLPNIQLPNEPLAYGIQRFDRGPDGRIHAEDFAQVFGLYPSDKYQKVNYEQLGKVLYRESANGREDIQQMARRLLINILLGNGDAHLKNWTICYPYRMLPRLAPLYDVVFTQPYIEYDNIALKMAKSKRWYDIGLSHFERWSQDVGVPWQMIKPHLLDTINLARNMWPNQLKQLPMLTEHKAMLRDHWKALHENFTIDS